MDSTKQELIDFLEQHVLYPAENNPEADLTIKRKIRATRMRLNNLKMQARSKNFSGMQWPQITG